MSSYATSTTLLLIFLLVTLLQLQVASAQRARRLSNPNPRGLRGLMGSNSKTPLCDEGGQYENSALCSCAGSCGEFFDDDSILPACYCDDWCENLGDCCPDYDDICN